MHHYRPMRSRPVLVRAALALALGALAVVAPASGASCTHLVTDPAGDATSFGDLGRYPATIDDPDQVDLRWSELRLTPTQVIATIRLQNLEPEGPRTLDHAYSLSFHAGGRGFQLIGFVDQDGGRRGWVNESVVDDSQPEDGGVYAGSAIGRLETRVDPRADTVTLVAERWTFGALRGPLSHISVVGWGAKHSVYNGETYAAADRATTTRSVQEHDRPCAG